MTYQVFYTIISSCIGFVSAIFFAVGSAFTSQTKMVAMSGTHWNFNKALAEAIVSQSTQYAVGSLLLFLAFLLQIVAASASQATLQEHYPVLLNVWLFVPLLLVSIGAPSWFLSKLLAKWRLSQVIKQLENINKS